MRRPLALLLLALLFGCEAGQSQFQFSGAGTVQVGRACAEGMVSVDDGRGCDAVLPAADCPAGTMPRLGSTACHPVGWTTCPPGFVVESSGWGCRAVRPEQPCTGATMQVLGATQCQPVGDCAAPFPPAEATLFVDDSFTTAQLDATHFRTVGAALTSAAAGAVIAVAAGGYSESLTFTRPARVMGQCAASVRLEGPGNGPGLLADGVTGVSVEGLTVTGFVWGAVAVNGGQLTLRQVVFDANRKVGVISDHATVSLTDSVVRRTVPHLGTPGVGVVAEEGTVTIIGSELTSNTEVELVVGGAAGQATVTGSLVHAPVVGATAGFSRLIHAERGARVQVERSEGSDAVGTAVLIRGSRLNLSESVLRRVMPNVDGIAAAAVVLSEGARGEVRRSAIADVRGIGLDATATTSLLVEDSTVQRSTLPPMRFSSGIQASRASLEVRRSAFVDNVVTGLHVTNGTQAFIEDSIFRGSVATPDFDGRGLNAEQSELLLVSSASVANGGLGLAVFGGRSTISGSVVLETGPVVGFSGGTGMIFSNDADALIDASAVSGSPEVGIGVFGSRVSVTRSVVRDGKLTYFGRYGDDVVALEGALLELVDTDLRTAKGLGLACSRSSARVHGGAFVGNNVALGAQDGSTVMVLAQPPPVEADLQVIISERTVFLDNVAKLAASSVLLPSIRPPLP